MKRCSDGEKIYSVAALERVFKDGDVEFNMSCSDKLAFVEQLGIDKVIDVCVTQIRSRPIPLVLSIELVDNIKLAASIKRTRIADTRLGTRLQSNNAATWTYNRDGVAVLEHGRLLSVCPSDLTLSTMLNGSERYAQRIKSTSPCPADLWTQDGIIKKAVRYVCTSASKKNTEALSLNRLRVFCMQGHGCRYGTAFPVPIAMALFRNEAAKLPATTRLCVVDPCAGWGDRLSAAILCDVDYFGMDPWPVSVALCARIHTRLGGRDGQRVVRSEGAEHAWPVDNQDAHMVFTSPPYGQLEQYGVAGPDDARKAQAWQLATDRFAPDFLCPMMQHAYDALRPGGCAIINIADSTHERLISATIAAAELAGFGLENVFGMSVSVRSTQIHGQSAARGEPLFVFRKPLAV